MVHLFVVTFARWIKETLAILNTEPFTGGCNTWVIGAKGMSWMYKWQMLVRYSSVQLQPIFVKCKKSLKAELFRPPHESRTVNISSLIQWFRIVESPLGKDGPIVTFMAATLLGWWMALVLRSQGNSVVPSIRPWTNAYCEQWRCSSWSRLNHALQLNQERKRSTTHLEFRTRYDVFWLG